MNTTLEDLKARAIQAHYGTSFSPEVRGENLIREFTEVLLDDLKQIETASDEQKEAYISKFKALLSAWIGAKSNCISTMITGPARFPVRRAEKANRSEQNKYELFTYWRSKAKKAILKSMEPEKTYLSEIDRYKKDLAGRQKLQEIMKASNAIIRKAKGATCTAELEAAGLSHDSAIKIQLPDYAGRIGFAQFNLTNNLANIHRIEGRIKEMEAKGQKATTQPEGKEIPFEGGRVVLDYSIDRVQIQHDKRPEYSVISLLKGAGFHWSPRNGCWMRQISPAAIWKAEQITGIKITA